MTRAKVSYSAITCISCQTEFIPRRKDQKFCCRTCKEHDAGKKQKIKTAANKEKHQLDKDLKFEKSSFGEYIYRECIRAKTIQILEGHSLESLLRLYDLYKRKVKFSGLINGKSAVDFQLSHIYPVTNKDYIGLLHPDNLVISSSLYNKQRRNKIPNLDSSWKIPKSNLNKRFTLKKGTPKYEVFKLIRELLGIDLYRSFIKSASLRNSRRERLIKNLIKLGYESNFLINLTIDELEALRFDETNKPQRTPSFQPASLAFVLKSELERTQRTKSVLFDLIEYLAHREHTRCNSVIGIDSDLETFVYQTTQNYLHDTNYSLMYQGNHVLSHLSVNPDARPATFTTALERQLYAHPAKSELFKLSTP